MSILRFDPMRDPFSQVDRLTHELLSGTRTPASLPMDVWRSGDTYFVALDLPGMNENSVDVTVERGALTIRAERQRAFGDGDTVVVAERPQGSFTRQLMLGDDLDADNIEADFRNGVLFLRIPVAQSAQPRRVEIRRNADSASIHAGDAETRRSAPHEPAAENRRDRTLVGSPA